MAVRHEVENLIRRGNIFYWRARVPVHFKACPKGSRLSLSLQTSDHRKAQVLARRLNTRLAEMRFESEEVMSTKKQLKKLFKHIRDDMLESLEEQNIAAKRIRGAGDVADMELDLEAGWAYQLLAKFGIRQTLTLEGDCTGLLYLQSNGVPKSHIPAIKHNYLAELQIARSPAALDRILQLMHTFDIEDTPLNHERAMSKFFEGRAAALLDIDERHALVDRRLSEFTGGGRGDAAATVTLSPVTDEAANSPSPFGVEYEIDVPEASIPTEEPPVFEPSPPPVTALEVAQSQSETNTDDETKPPRVLSLEEFDREVANVIKNKEHEWSEETARNFASFVGLFKTVLEEHGVKHSGQIEQYHIGQLRLHLNDIPVHWGKGPKLKFMTAPQLRAEGARLREAAQKTGKKPNVGLAPNTIRKHFGNLTHFTDHVRDHGFELAEITINSLRPKKLNAALLRRQQHKPKPDEIVPIFESVIYTGCKDYGRGRKKPGPNVYHDAIYYLPVLFTYLGARRKEFAGLTVDDIQKQDDHHVILIDQNELRGIKNFQSQRALPLPDELVRLGFLDYHAAIKDLGYRPLFPDLFSDKTNNDPGDRFYDVFTPIMREALGEKMWDRALHALRHGLADTLKQMGVSDSVISDIAGRLPDTSETASRYTNPAGLPLMREVLAKYPTITECIEPQPLRLLPWVATKQPPPWAREGKKVETRK